MKREHIQLLSRARRGEHEACFEVARGYLSGSDGFPRHIPLGLKYVQLVQATLPRQANELVADSLELHEIIQHGVLPALQVAARLGKPDHQFKLAVWSALSQLDANAALSALDGTLGDGSAAISHQPAAQPASDTAIIASLREHVDRPGIEWQALLLLAAEHGLRTQEPLLVMRAVTVTLAFRHEITPRLADGLCAALQIAQRRPSSTITVPARSVNEILETCIGRDDTNAALLLGNALCGVNSGSLRWNALTPTQNKRRGAALLLRAADAGHHSAWLPLYEVHAEEHGSVANPPMAQFFLEKAAQMGDSSAQRRLGAIILKNSVTLNDSEKGLFWLNAAAQAGDAFALELLRSFVLDVQGEAEEAERALALVAKSDPWLALRLRTARDFGLTRLEALSVDLVTGLRPWGLVVGRNPFTPRTKLAHPRAIPALSEAALKELRRSAGFLGECGQSATDSLADLKRRLARLRHILKRHHLPESLFFSDASSAELEQLRVGTKWSFKVKIVLTEALAAEYQQTESKPPSRPINTRAHGGFDRTAQQHLGTMTERKPPPSLGYRDQTSSATLTER